MGRSNIAVPSIYREIHGLGVTLDQGNHGVMTSIYESMAKMKILQEMKTFYAATDIEMIDSAEKVMNIGLNVFGKDYPHLKPILTNRCAVLAEIPFLKVINFQKQFFFFEPKTKSSYDF